jgi:hypothetical protein
VDASELAKMMLQWEQARKRLDELEEAIRDSVLQMGETQTAGNVRATYSKGRKKYDYQTATDGHPMVSDATVGLFTKVSTTTRIDWRGICKHAGIDDVPFTEGTPSVSIKLQS